MEINNIESKKKYSKNDNDGEEILTKEASRDLVGEGVFSKSKIIVTLSTLVIIASFFVYYKNNYIKISNTNDNNVPVVNQSVTDDQRVLAQLKKIILLPEDVKPTMAIITSVEVLKQKQPSFFANAQDNEWLIIYPELAIIYDYVKNKIIKVGPVQTIQSTSTNVAK